MMGTFDLLRKNLITNSWPSTHHLGASGPFLMPIPAHQRLSFLHGNSVVHGHSLEQRGRLPLCFQLCLFLALSLSAHPGLGFLPTKIDRALRAPRLAAQGTARGILTFTEYRVPCSRMVPPCLGPEQTEQIWGDHEHGDAGVEHLVNGINELLGLRVHYLLQRP